MQIRASCCRTKADSITTSKFNALRERSAAGWRDLRKSRTVQLYSTGRSQHNTDFAKTNQNEVVRIRTNFFEYFLMRK